MNKAGRLTYLISRCTIKLHLSKLCSNGLTIDVHMDQCNKTGTPEIDEHVHGQLIVNKDINATQQRKTVQQMVLVKCLEEANEPQPHTRITCYSLLK